MNRYAWTILTALLVLTAAPLQAQPSITFAPSSIEAGDTWMDHSILSTAITFRRNDSYRDLPSDSRSTSVDRTKIVKVTQVTGNGKIGGLEVRYLDVEQDGVGRTSLFAGKVYVVTLKGNRATGVRYADDAAVPEDEAAFVLWDNNRHEQARAMNRTFGGKTVAIGEELRGVDPDDLIDADAGMTVRDFVMKLESVSPDGEEATFAVKLEMASSVKKRKDATADDEEPFGTTRLDLEGTLVAHTNSRILRLDLRGPASVDGTKLVEGGARGAGSTKVPRAKTIQGTGTARLTTTYVYP